jgi:Skp family chaperone for outer membrane proteins
MNSRLKAAAAIVLAACVAGSYSYASEGTPPAKKHTVHKKAEPKGPTVEEQIQSLRNELQGQIDALKTDLATKDEQLKQAQQQAADAQAAAAKAQQEATDGQQALTANTAAVSTLQSTVTDLKGTSASLAATISDNDAAIRKSIENPDVIHFKGDTISFTGSFLAAETVWRQGATGGGLNTPFTGVPLDNSDNAQISEFQGSGRQSRLAIKSVGKLPNWTLSGYYEADWLSAGITSNNNQSNSYTMRQRQLWADAKSRGGADISGGQGWSLVTETTQGLTRGTEILPASIDPQYETGFVWTRQYSFRMSKDFGNKFFLGASAENAETLNPAGSGLPTNVLIGSAGAGGGLYNATANYSFNYSPDFVAKIAFQPGWGHWEIFGLERNFRERIYPNEACTTTGTTTTCTNSTGAYNNVVPAGGIGGGFRVPLANKKLTLGLKGLWGKGVGRYGSSTIADITLRPDGTIDPLKAFSALSTVELNPTPRLMIYFNYGGDYVYRDIFYGAGGKETGYGTYTTNMSGCNVEPVPSTSTNPGFGGGTGFTPSNPSNCGNQTKDVQEFAAGDWYDFYHGPKGRMRFGLQYSRFERDIWSGAGGATNPGGGAHGIDNMFWTSFRYYLP